MFGLGVIELAILAVLGAGVLLIAGVIIWFVTSSKK